MMTKRLIAGTRSGSVASFGFEMEPEDWIALAAVGATVVAIIFGYLRGRDSRRQTERRARGERQHTRTLVRDDRMFDARRSAYEGTLDLIQHRLRHPQVGIELDLRIDPDYRLFAWFAPYSINAEAYADGIDEPILAVGDTGYVMSFYGDAELIDQLVGRAGIDRAAVDRFLRSDPVPALRA